jgi:hypothetical protein
VTWDLEMSFLILMLSSEPGLGGGDDPAPVTVIACEKYPVPVSSVVVRITVGSGDGACWRVPRGKLTCQQLAGLRLDKVRVR